LHIKRPEQRDLLNIAAVNWPGSLPVGCRLAVVRKMRRAIGACFADSV
jgi:hypothetical protein